MRTNLTNIEIREIERNNQLKDRWGRKAAQMKEKGLSTGYIEWYLECKGVKAKDISMLLKYAGMK